MFICYFHQSFEATSKLLYLAMICCVTWPYPGHWWVGVGHFLDWTVFAAFSWSFAGKIIVPVHWNISNDTPTSYLSFLHFKTLKIRAWIGRNAFVFAAQTSACTMSILKRKILSGISFAKINKNGLNYPLKLFSWDAQAGLSLRWAHMPFLLVLSCCGSYHMSVPDHMGIQMV